MAKGEMVKGSLMRRLTFHLVIAALTFAAGVTGSHLAHNFPTHSATVNGETRGAEAFALRSTTGHCEVHGLTLQAVRVQTICGEYRGSDGAYMSLGCGSHRKRRISREDAPFLIRSGGLKTHRWFADSDAARYARFPHGYGWENQDCDSTGEPCVTVDSCAECRAAEVAWKRNSSKRWR